MSGDPAVVYLGSLFVTGTVFVTAIDKKPIDEAFIPASHLYVAIDRLALFPSGIFYSVSIDSSGSSVVQVDPDKTYISNEYLYQCLQQDIVNWSGTQLLNVSLIPDASSAFKTDFPVSPWLAATESNRGSLGDQILYILSKVITINGTVEDSRFQNHATLSQQITRSVANWLADALRSVDVLDSIIKRISAYNGPAIKLNAGEHVFKFVPGLRDISFVVTLDSVRFKLAYALGTTELVLGQIPIVLTMKDLGP